MNTTLQTCLEVIDVGRTDERIIIVAKLLSGEPSANMVLKSEETSAQWRVKATAFVPSEAWQKGMRSLLIEPIGDAEHLHKGELLLSTS
jgi:hypothetical protein